MADGCCPHCRQALEDFQAIKTSESGLAEMATPDKKEHKLIGTVHVGYRVIAAEEAPVKYPPRLVPAESIALAKSISDETPTKYVIWEYVGNGEFRSGVYKDNEAEAQNIFNSRTKQKKTESSGYKDVREKTMNSAPTNEKDAAQVAHSAKDEYIDACFSLNFDEKEELCKRASREQALMESEKDSEIFDLFMAGKKEEALELAKSLKNDMKDSDIPYVWISRIYHQQTKNTEAKEAIKSGLKNAKKKRLLCGYMAAIYEEESNIAETVKWWIRSMLIQFKINEFDEYHWLYLAAIAYVLGLDKESSKLKAYCRKYELSGEAVSKFRQQLENNIFKESIRQAIQRFVNHIELKQSYPKKINAPNGVYCILCQSRYSIEECIDPKVEDNYITFTCPKCNVPRVYNMDSDTGF